MKVATRLKEFLKVEGISARTVDLKCGFTHGFISRTIKQGSELRTDKLVKIKENYPKINVNWLVGADVQMYVDDERSELENVKKLLAQAQDELQWHKNHAQSLLNAFEKGK